MQVDKTVAQSQESLQAGLDLIDQGFTLIDKELRLVAWNRAFLRLLEFPLEMGRAGTPFEDFMRYNALRGEYGEGEPEKLVRERVDAARTFQAHDIVRTRPNGRVLRVRGFPVPGHGFVTLYSDITEGRRAEETIRQQNAELESRVAERTAKLHRSEQQMRLISDSIPALIAYFDAGKVYRYINRGYEEWFGLDAANPDKVSAREYLGADVYKGIRGNVSQALAGTPVSYEYELITRDGQARVARTTLIPDKTTDGVVAGCFELTFDITEQRKTQAMLMQAEKMEALGQLTGGLAHDFNNILTIIIGNLETMRSELSSKVLEDEYVMPALTAARRGTELIRGLMTFSRKQSLHAQPVEMRSALDAICRLVRPSLPERIELTHGPAGPACWATLDAGELENALLNLIMNARDAIEKSGNIHLSVHHTEVDDAKARQERVTNGPYVCIEIRDTGCGMDDATLKRVFEPFFTTKAPGRGTGLGMAMVYGYIQQSGGFIQLQSTPGFGTCVQLCFPQTDAGMDVLDGDELLH
jgi:PAS domain S-box-containing protein